MLRPDLFRALVMLNTPVPPRGRVKPTVCLAGNGEGQGMTRPVLSAGRQAGPRVGQRSCARPCVASSTRSPAAPSAPNAGACSSNPANLSSMPSPTEGVPVMVERPGDRLLRRSIHRTGFTGALNYYRCRDRIWEITAFLEARSTGAEPVHRWRADPSLEPSKSRSLRPAKHLFARAAEKSVAIRRGP